MLFTELPFFERFSAAQKAGFHGVEFLFPYEFAAAEIKHALDACGLPLVLFNTPAGDWQKGQRGFAALPDAEHIFSESLKLAMEYAAVLRPLHIHIMSGIAKGEAARLVLIKNLKAAAKENPDQSFLIEPLNVHDAPGYFLDDFLIARRVIETVGEPNLCLQFDAFHAKRMGRNVAQYWDANRDLVRHIQIAGTPGRHEPIPSEINYAAFFRQIDRDGYDGFVSGEYHPKGKTAQGLGWLST
jgi:2-dehydrotetronate isomerase